MESFGLIANCFRWSVSTVDGSVGFVAAAAFLAILGTALVPFDLDDICGR